MRKVPEFKSEEEELSFWDKHDPEDFDAGPAEDVILDIKPETKKRDSCRNGTQADKGERSLGP